MKSYGSNRLPVMFWICELHENAVKVFDEMSNRSAHNSVNFIQTITLKGSSFHCFVNVLKSLIDWEELQKEYQSISSSQYANLSNGYSCQVHKLWKVVPSIGSRRLGLYYVIFIIIQQVHSDFYQTWIFPSAQNGSEDF